MADIDLVVVNYGTYDLVQKLIDSYYNHRPSVDARMVLIDNESNTRKLQRLRSRGIDVFPQDENIGYARACNAGFSVTDSRYVAFCNSDIQFLNSSAVDRMVAFMDENPEVAIVGPLQISSAGPSPRVTHAGIVGDYEKPIDRGWKKRPAEFRFNDEVISVAGSFLVARRSAMEEIMSDEVFRKHWPDAVGPMPEHSLYFEDTAICYAVRKFGHKVFFLGEDGCEVVHSWHGTISRHGEGDHYKRSRESFMKLMRDWEIL